MDFFAAIIGQERAVGMLRQALITGKISHAYLFSGPAGVGKLTTALALARTLVLSSDPQGEAFWREGAHPDFKLIQKAEKKTMIGIEQINQDLEPWLALKPYRAEYRVVVIDQAHLMSLPAANALLKTLEEPPGHAVIILVAEEQKLLETILSRCQLIRFASLSDKQIGLFLEQRGIEPARAAYLARLAQGSIAAALEWTEEEKWREIGEKARTMVQAMAQGPDLEVFRCAEAIEKDPLLMTGMLSALLRDIYVFQATGQTGLLVLEENQDLYARMRMLDPQRVKGSLQKMDELGRQFRGPVNPLLLSINISYLLQDALK